MVNRLNTYEPDYVSPPGDTLLELLSESGMSQKELAIRMDRPEKTINEIIKGKAVITPDTALQLEHVFRVPARFWIQREGLYQEYLAKHREVQELQNSVDWLNILPLSSMIKYGWINKFNQKTDQLKEVLNFFGVASVSGWESVWSGQVQKTSYRISKVHTSDVGALATWLRHGEIKCKNVDLPVYDEKLFKSKVQHFRSLTRKNQSDFQDDLINTCAEAGVALVFSPPIPKAHVNGAVRWCGDHPLIQISPRGRNNDIFWFTFFHEVGHVVLHGKKDVFIEVEKDGHKDEKEKEADEYAANVLIPQSLLSQFVEKEDFSPNCIIRFAKELDIHSAIVVGQLQKNEYISYSYLNELKKKLDLKMDI